MSTKKMACVLCLIVSTAHFAQRASALPDRPAPGESSNTQINLIIPGKHPGFQNKVLETSRHQYDPHVKNKEIEFDKLVDKSFRHATGSDTMRNFTLGAARSTKPGMQYFVTIAIYDGRGKRTHVGEKDGVRGPCSVLTVGKPNQVNM